MLDEVNVMDLGRLHGSVPPLVTPLREDGQIDHESLARLVDYTIDAGGHGSCAIGTTGEFACFDADDGEATVRTTVGAVRGRVPAIACIGDASSSLAIEHGHRASRAGADFVAVTRSTTSRTARPSSRSTSAPSLGPLTGRSSSTTSPRPSRSRSTRPSSAAWPATACWSG